MTTTTTETYLSATDISDRYFDQTGRRINTVKIGMEATRLGIKRIQREDNIPGIVRKVRLKQYAVDELPKLFLALDELDPA